MAFYKQKGWYKSRTVWTGIVSALIGVLTMIGYPLPIESSEVIVGGIMAVVGALTVLFRAKADSAIVVSEKL